MSYLWRNCAFGYQGYVYFTKNTLLGNPCVFDKNLIRDASGKSFMVTGANSGIGKEIVIQLSKYSGATIHMVCRNSDRGEAALKEIMSHCHPNTSILLHTVDVSSIQDIVKFTDDFQQKNHNLHVLINNAGVLNENLILTAEGLESSFALNVAGTYLLTERLIPLLKKSGSNEKSRVITVSSGGMLTERLNCNDPQLNKGIFDGVKSYAQQKRQQVVLTHCWANEHSDVNFYSMHPGWVDTPGVAQSLPMFYDKMKSRLRTVAEGADSILWLSLIKETSLPISGSFIFDRKVSNEHITFGGTSHSETEVETYLTNLKNIVKRVFDHHVK